MVTETCVHYWMIEPSNGHKSPGVCKHCGETREFTNSFERKYDEMGNLRSKRNDLDGHGDHDANPETPQVE